MLAAVTPILYYVATSTSSRERASPEIANLLSMVDSPLTELRRARSRCHFALKQAETLAESYRAKLAGIEAAIQAIAPDLQLPPRLHKPNPIFARGELRRLAIDILRETGEPLSIRDMAVGALRAVVGGENPRIDGGEHRLMAWPRGVTAALEGDRSVIGD